jgi:hypothetical protein
MSGSALGGYFQVFEATTDTAACGCGPIATPQTCSLPAGEYYVLFRGDSVLGGAGDQPFSLVMRDASGLGSVACQDGATSTGTTIERQLDVGTYYVGITSRSGVAPSSHDYQLLIKDASSSIGVGSNEIDCGSEIETNVVAGEPYYVVVKGTDTGDSGPYELTVQDLSGVPSFGTACNDDLTSGDAFFEFAVTNPAGTRVTIDTEGSALGASIALFPEGFGFADSEINSSGACWIDPANCVNGSDGNPDDLIACDDGAGAGAPSFSPNTGKPGPQTFSSWRFSWPVPAEMFQEPHQFCVQCRGYSSFICRFREVHQSMTYRAFGVTCWSLKFP